MTRSWLSRKAFESLVQEALKGLPHEFRRCLKNVAIEIEEEPTNQALHALGIAEDDPDELLGLWCRRRHRSWRWQQAPRRRRRTERGIGAW